jgi:hypothetical protein
MTQTKFQAHITERIDGIYEIMMGLATRDDVKDMIGACQARSKSDAPPPDQITIRGNGTAFKIIMTAIAAAATALGIKANL